MLMLLLSFGAAWLLEQPSSSLPPTLQVLDDQELRGIEDPGHVDLLARQDLFLTWLLLFWLLFGNLLMRNQKLIYNSHSQP